MDRPEPDTPDDQATPRVIALDSSLDRPADQTCPLCSLLLEQFPDAQQVAYWQTMFRRARQREDALRRENDQLRARLRLREQQLFGRKTETSPSPSQANPAEADPAARKSRGQQPGRPAPKRRDHSHLPAVEEHIELPAEERNCPGCGLPSEPFEGTEDGQILEVEVKPHRRVYRRHRYRRGCACRNGPGILTAPVPPKLIPKSNLGTSIWAEVLLDKYLFYRPTYRLLADWKTLGLDLSLGTLTDGLRRLVPLFEPLYQALIDHNQRQKHWHADETRWMVFDTVEGKVGHRWMLWVFHSREASVFVLDRGRAHDVPEEHLGPQEEGILSVDRYSAYKAMSQVKDGQILLAYCWAHVRRDFLGVAKSWPKLEGWALAWVGRIGELYRANKARAEASGHRGRYARAEGELKRTVERMEQSRVGELSEEGLHPAKRKVLESLAEHWEGLTVFVVHPEVPMDNNAAERQLRGPVVGRKNYRGSGSVWSGQLAAMLMSIFQTLCQWGLNPRRWLEEYLNGCAKSGGKPPEQLGRYLPWEMTEQQRQDWQQISSQAKPDSS